MIQSLWLVDNLADVNLPDGISLPGSFIGLCVFGTNNITSFLVILCLWVRVVFLLFLEGSGEHCLSVSGAGMF